MADEFELIERYFLTKSHRKDVIMGVGDDAAVLRPPSDMELVVTVDTLVEGVHFPTGTDAESIGYKALAVNLSDLAAMGARPAWITLSLTLPRSEEAWLSAFCEGFFKLARYHDVALVGGDLTHGSLSMTVQAIGFAPRSSAIYRRGAQPGDEVLVTGYLGDAGLALAAIRQFRELDGESLAYCLGRLNRPTPRVEAGLALRNCASAAIDISDGLVADLEHVLRASDVGASLYLASLPLSPILQKAFAVSPDWRLPLASGDDYELLFTAPQSKLSQLYDRFVFIDCMLTRIGRIESKAGLRLWDEEGDAYHLEQAGYNHFRL
jgi:thiamine-monophosphate kinase